MGGRGGGGGGGTVKYCLEDKQTGFFMAVKLLIIALPSLIITSDIKQKISISSLKQNVIHKT